MKSPIRLHILGASGSGTSTLGRAIAKEMGIVHFDTDDFYWAPSEVPFTVKRAINDRLTMFRSAIAKHPSWVLSGSLCSWGDPLVPLFTQVVFLHVPWDVRSQRLTHREQSRYGEEAIAPGGVMYDVCREFIDWASRYDSAGLEQRSYASHNHWLGELPELCQVMRIEDPALSTAPIEEIAGAVIDQL